MTGAAITLAVACFVSWFGYWCADEEAKGRIPNETVAGWTALVIVVSAGAIGYSAEAFVRWVSS